MKTATAILFSILCVATYGQYSSLKIKEQYDDIQYEISIASNNSYYSGWTNDNGARVQYQNNLGDGMSFVTASYLNMYKATGDKAYLIKFIKEAIKIQEKRWDSFNDPFTGYSPKWTQDEEQESTYQNGNILWPMAEFVHMVRSDNSLYCASIPHAVTYDVHDILIDNKFGIDFTTYSYGGFANWLRQRLITSITYMLNYYWDDDLGFIKHPGDEIPAQLNWQGGLSGAMLLTGLPDNFTSGIAQYLYNSLIICLKYLGSVDIDGTLFPVLKELGNNSYAWFASGWSFNGSVTEYFQAPEDISHALQSSIFVRIAHEYENWFTQGQMARFKNTFRNNIWCDNPFGLNNNVFGGLTVCYDNTGCQTYPQNHFENVALHWMAFSEFDDLNDPYSVYEKLMNYYNIYPSGCSYMQRDANSFSGQGFYGVSEFVKAQWREDCPDLTLRNRDVVYDQDFYSKNVLTVDPALPNHFYNTEENAFADPTSFTADEFIIKPGINVNMTAANKIELKPGFHAMAGCNFHASINPSLCQPGSKSLIIAADTSNVNSENNIVKQTAETDESNNFSIKLYPNPAITYAVIEMHMPENGFINIIIFDHYGRKVMTVYNGSAEKGTKKLIFPVSKLSEGLYYSNVMTESGNSITIKLAVTH